jgi:chromosome segregation ATPase
VTTPSTPSEASSEAPPEVSSETPPDPELDAEQEALKARQAALAAVRKAQQSTDLKILSAKRAMARATQRAAELEARKVEVEAEMQVRMAKLEAELVAELEVQEAALQAALAAQKALRKKTGLTAELRAEMAAQMQVALEAERKAEREAVLEAVRKCPESVNRGGRPFKGERIGFHVKLPEEFRDEIEAVALAAGLPMGAIITRLVALALNVPTPDYCWPRPTEAQEAEWRAAVRREALGYEESPLDKAS